MRSVISSTASRSASALLAVVVSAAGCATKGDLRNVQNELRLVADRQDSILVELQRQRRFTEETLGTQTRELTDDLRGDVSQQLRDVTRSIDALMEMAGQNGRDIAAIRDQMATSGQRTGGGAFGSTGASGAPDNAVDPDALYEAGYDAYQRTSFAAARTAFNQYLEMFPRGLYAPRVHMHLADILAQEGRMDEAVDKYMVVPEEFPTDPEVSTALYRVALLHIDRGDDDEARRVLNTILNTYPDDPNAELARDRLDELGG